jgi:hypothetical protein
MDCSSATKVSNATFRSGNAERSPLNLAARRIVIDIGDGNRVLEKLKLAGIHRLSELRQSRKIGFFAHVVRSSA